MSFDELADEHGVTRQAISDIVNNKKWIDI